MSTRIIWVSLYAKKKKSFVLFEKRINKKRDIFDPLQAPNMTSKIQNKQNVAHFVEIDRWFKLNITR